VVVITLTRTLAVDLHQVAVQELMRREAAAHMPRRRGSTYSQLRRLVVAQRACNRLLDLDLPNREADVVTVTFTRREAIDLFGVVALKAVQASNRADEAPHGPEKQRLERLARDIRNLADKVSLETWGNRAACPGWVEPGVPIPADAACDVPTTTRRYEITAVYAEAS
jgi:hypothetical protein